MNSDQGAIIDGDDKAIDSEFATSAESRLNLTAETNQLSEFESSQATDNLFDWLKIANHAYDCGDLEQAKQCYLRALEHCSDELPDQAEFLRVCSNRLADIYLKLNQPDQAIEVLSSAQYKRKPADSDRWQKFGLNIAIIVAFALCCMSINFRPSASSVIDSKDDGITGMSVAEGSVGKFVSPIHIGAEFKTADQLSTLKLANVDTVYRWDHGRISEAKYVVSNFSFGDVLKLFSGSRKNRKNFVITAADYLVDDTGLTFYASGAPEVKLVERMWWYPSFINFYYGKFHKYPSKEEAWMNTIPNYSYTNPFTGKSEKADFASLTNAEQTPPAVARPGAILILSSFNGQCTICGYDRNSRLIPSADPGKPLLLQLRSGVNVTEEYFNSFGGKCFQVKTDPPELLVFSSDPGLKGLLQSSEAYVPAIAIPLWLASLTLSLFLFRVFFKSPARILAFAPILLPSLLLAIVIWMWLGG
ncbi:MAG: tetratricopeptide repeat protein [Candidatus Melainabacteria bacterium]|nr:tetratricopeptide repeat protein [Candidatus Melainabacteria bacterium]